MGKLYLITGDNYLVDRKMKSIIKQVGVDEFNTIIYDIEETPFSDAITDAATIPFMSDSKVVVVRNTDFKEREGFIIDDFISMLSDIPSFLHLIIIPNKPLDKRSKIVKMIYEIAEVIALESLAESTMKDSVKGFLEKREIRIHDDALNELIKRAENKTHNIMNELNKLDNYFSPGEVVYINDICDLVAKNVESDVFQLVNKVVDRDLTSAMSICYDLMRTEDPIRLLGLIINKFREINYAKTLLSKGHSDQDLMKFFNASSGRVYYIKKNANRVSEDYISKQLEVLANTELKIKKGLLDKKVGLEMFILNI